MMWKKKSKDHANEIHISKLEGALPTKQHRKVWNVTKKNIFLLIWNIFHFLADIWKIKCKDEILTQVVVFVFEPMLKWPRKNGTRMDR